MTRYRKLQIITKCVVTIMGSKKRNSKKLKHIKKDKNTISKRKGIILIAISLVILSGVLGFTFMYDENISDPNVKPVDVVENQEPVELTDEEKKAINTSAQDVKKMIDEVDLFLKES